MPPRGSDDRLFARDGFKHFRRTYSLAEVRWGLAVGVVLCAIAVWVYWKGQNPDPSLFAAPPLQGGQGAAASSGDRGPVPTDLAAAGWTEGEPSQFDASNLYVKINGRADYFLSYGFERLYFVPLRAGDDDEAATIEVEVYDLGTPANALGVFAGERKSGEGAAGSGKHLARNALFLVRGKYYVRAIGSEESPAMTAQLEHIAARMEAGLEAGERPWAYQLFEGVDGVAADRIAYQPRNAFSIEAATDVYVATLADDTQLFAAVRGDAAAAEALAAAVREGFAEVGEADGAWVVDRYLDTLATAVAVDRFVIGVRGAPDRAKGEAALAAVREALIGLSPEVLDSASFADPGPEAGAEAEAEGGTEPLPEQSYDSEEM